MPGADPEVDARDPELGQPVEQLAARPEHVALVMRGRQRADPAVEHLDRAGAGVDLARGRRQARSTRAARAAPHQVCGSDSIKALVRACALRRAPLDEIAGERERAADEADQRHLQLRHHEPAGLRQPRGILGGFEVTQHRQIRCRAHGIRDHRADSRPDLESHADRRERADDVGEQDRGVDAVAAHRLQGDLGSELRRMGDLQHPCLGAHGAVLRQRATRLTHEPHRDPLGRLAAVGSQQRGLRSAVGSGLGERRARLQSAGDSCLRERRARLLAREISLRVHAFKLHESAAPAGRPGCLRTGCTVTRPGAAARADPPGARPARRA